MTLSTLAEKSGISVRSITAFENGHKQPAEDTVVRFASALDLPIGFFGAHHVEPIPIDGVSFRALSKMTALDRDAALAAGQMAVLIHEWLIRNFRLPERCVPTLPNLSPELAAERVRGLWGLGEAPIPNLIRVMEANGVRVFSLAFDCDSVDAFSVTYRGQPFVFANTSKSAERMRFDGAHELGHLVLHSEDRVAHGLEAEDEAQKFAAAFLMPRAGVVAQGLTNPTIEQVLRAKSMWKVSAVAYVYRLHEIGMLNDWRYRLLIKQLSQLGYRSSEPRGVARESSQLLYKVFSTLRAESGGWRNLLEQVQLTEDELNRHVFGLVPIGLAGGEQSSPPVRPSLKVLRGGHQTGYPGLLGSDRVEDGGERRIPAAPKQG